MTRAGSRQALRQALAFALEGLRYAARTQRAFRIQLESAVTVLSILVVLVVELINTGVEVVVDLLVERNHHALAKVAKDVAAAAVVVAAAGAAVVGLLILGPPLGSALGLGAGTAARWSRIGAVVALLAGAGALLWIGARGRSSS